MTYDLSGEERETLIDRYRLPGEVARLLREVEQGQARLEHLATPGRRNSEVDRLLHPLSEAALHVLCYAAPSVSEVIVHYLTALRPVRPLLDGHALRHMGVAPGPQIGHLLREVRAARLDGLVTSREDEEAWVAAWLINPPADRGDTKSG
jgi:tRNA nucleotidyltransferase (CCA-adding enzyme)